MENNSIQNVPPKLYKYQKFNLQTLENLQARKTWFSDPENFNDPYDPAPPYPSELNDNDLQKIFEFFKKANPSIDLDKVWFFSDEKPNENFRKITLEVLQKHLPEYRATMFGISCFSAIKDDILMWAHYADGHRGFCLEFDAQYAPFCKAHKVVYSPTYPLINLTEFLEGKQSSTVSPALEKLLLTKSEHWKYEQEWRIFFDKNSEFVFDAPALTGIYFGIAMPQIHKEIITQILANSPTLCYEMRPSIAEFRLDEPFLFTG